MSFLPRARPRATDHETTLWLRVLLAAGLGIISLALMIVVVVRRPTPDTLAMLPYAAGGVSKAQYDLKRMRKPRPD